MGDKTIPVKTPTKAPEEAPVDVMASMQQVWEGTVQQKQKTLQELRTKEAEILGFMEKAKSDLVGVVAQINHVEGGLTMGKSMLDYLTEQQEKAAGEVPGDVKE